MVAVTIIVIGALVISVIGCALVGPTSSFSDRDGPSRHD